MINDPAWLQFALNGLGLMVGAYLLLFRRTATNQESAIVNKAELRELRNAVGRVNGMPVKVAAIDERQLAHGQALERMDRRFEQVEQKLDRLIEMELKRGTKNGSV